MSLPRKYDPRAVEAQMRTRWEELGVYGFASGGQGEVVAIDTPPATVSGALHLGHVYSYSQADFMARFWRMKGFRVFYPMGYDDNGLPTERLVERDLGMNPRAMDQTAFSEACLDVARNYRQEYEAVWRRLGLSVDWQHTYSTIGREAVRLSQHSFIDLWHKDLVYRSKAPAIWCPECRTAVAQAELNELERDSQYVVLDFPLDNGAGVQIATTRPELLSACVAIFVHPQDERFRAVVGQRATVPGAGHTVPILEDVAADPTKGTGAVMCCTFGDSADVEWWRGHDLPTVEILDRDGRLTEEAGDLGGLPVAQARHRAIERLTQQGLILRKEPTTQTVRVHERCDTAVEYLVAHQWFVKVLEHKQELLEIGERINWHPHHARTLYTQWIENLRWDWCISRQRHFGVRFPLWHCDACGEIRVADQRRLPLNPAEEAPEGTCGCGSTSYRPETDVMDTWATSSLTPQIAGRWLEDEALHKEVFPMTVRPQSHEIIRTWTFYTVVKSWYHFGEIPWTDIAISGWGLAPEGSGKISKSRGGGPATPDEMMDRYSADAVRYWAACTGFGRDSVINEEKIQAGHRLAVKLWNVARFAQTFMGESGPPPAATPPLSVADRWILSREQRVIQAATEALDGYEYSQTKAEVEAFFWRDLADNYLEMAKRRLYDGESPEHEGALFALHHVLATTLKLLAPFVPHVTDAVYQEGFAQQEGMGSIHQAPWPTVDGSLVDDGSERIGSELVAVATAVRRYKTESGLRLGAELGCVYLATEDARLRESLEPAEADIASITRATTLEIQTSLPAEALAIKSDGAVAVAVTTLNEDSE